MGPADAGMSLALAWTPCAADVEGDVAADLPAVSSALPPPTAAAGAVLRAGKEAAGAGMAAAAGAWARLEALGATAATASALTNAGEAMWPGGSASSVKRRVTRELQPALRFTCTSGSSIACEVRTRTRGVGEVVSSTADTAERGRGMSPTVTSTLRHSGGASPGSRRNATLKSNGTPSTAEVCARPKPQAPASRGSVAPRAMTVTMYSGDRFKWRSPKELTLNWSAEDSSMEPAPKRGSATLENGPSFPSYGAP